MKKSLLICVMLFIGVQTFSFSPGNIKTNTSSTLPYNINAISLQELLNLTPKRYQELTGKKMTFKEKIGLWILKAKLKKQLPDDKIVSHNTDIGKTSLILGAGAFLVALIPVVGLLSIAMAAAAVVLGIIGLGRKKGDTKSIIGLVLGSVFLLLIIALIAAFASGSWWH